MPGERIVEDEKEQMSGEHIIALFILRQSVRETERQGHGLRYGKLNHRPYLNGQSVSKAARQGHSLQHQLEQHPSSALIFEAIGQ